MNISKYFMYVIISLFHLFYQVGMIQYQQCPPTAARTDIIAKTTVILVLS